jgi:DNA-binding beta-propeller fold protein YncE
VRSIFAALATAALVLTASAAATRSGGNPVALVTAETDNALFAVELPSGRVLRRVPVPADPQNVASTFGRGGVVVVVSPRAATVTLLDRRTLKMLKVLRGFRAPHLTVISPDGRWAYVTDDPRGQLDVIELGTRRLVERLFVGTGAHHLTVSPQGRRLWIALGERAREIAIVDLARPTRPRLLRRFAPGFTVHDLSFSPDGRRVWVTSATGDSVHVLDARKGRQLFRVRVGTAPQHVAFAERGFAFVTSGYSSRIAKVDPGNGRVVGTAKTPYGSFNLSTIGDLVVTTSLSNGRVTEFDVDLRRLTSVKVARVARGVTLTVW